MDNGLIKIFEKTNYCINPNTVEEIIPIDTNNSKYYLDIHFISGKTRKLEFDNKEDMDLFISKTTRKD